MRAFPLSIYKKCRGVLVHLILEVSLVIELFCNLDERNWQCFYLLVFLEVKELQPRDKSYGKGNFIDELFMVKWISRSRKLFNFSFLQKIAFNNSFSCRDHVSRESRLIALGLGLDTDGESYVVSD